MEPCRISYQVTAVQSRGIEWSMRKWCISENISPVSKSQHSKQESRNLGLAAHWTVSKSWTFIIQSRIFKKGSRSLTKSQIYHSIPLKVHHAVLGNLLILVGGWDRKYSTSITSKEGIVRKTFCLVKSHTFKTLSLLELQETVKKR